MPNTLFLIGSGLTFFVWWILRKNNETLDDNESIVSEKGGDRKSEEDQTDEKSISLAEIADNSPNCIEIAELSAISAKEILFSSV
jgi:hypothetical protein